MAGVLYGVGVGPGDPELITVKALRIIRECSVIGIPAREAAECTAYKIARLAYPEIEKKKVLAVPVPMTTEEEKLKTAYERGFLAVKEQLDSGENVAFLNLGDPSIYGTYMMLHEKALEAGYHAEMISGVPSFCAAAAVLNVSLGRRKEKIHILPGDYCAGDLQADGTKILMKATDKTGVTRRLLSELIEEDGAEVCGVTNCGMKDQKIYRSFSDFQEARPGYFTTLIVKDGSSCER